MQLHRRSLLQAAGLGSLLTSLAAWVKGIDAQGPDSPYSGHASSHSNHLLGTVGRVAPAILDPTRYLRTWNFNHLPPHEREKFYRETARPDGSMLREYELFAVDQQLEIAPGVMFLAWTYNGQVPGPTIRVTEGDRVRVRFLNQGSHPHTIHFHGWHHPSMDGSLPEHQVPPGESFVYEFDAEPAGLHLYHCHTVPLKRHLHRGLYGAYIVDPREGRPPADELVMVMNGFDTNFDSDNEVYAVNTVANAYMNDPVRVTVGRPVRIYLVNITEFDLLNSFHLHGMFFDALRTGGREAVKDHTDTIMLCQGERAVLEMTFRYPGDFMFHAHQSEFAELGWMGIFRAMEARRES
ncbi:MAG TPA: multicopper oxidase domain-containing protein [Vicinamibacterales bacterium]|nr:multicopper oxidase domain-containing protein [Vicinamibacterales bacterium]